MAAGTVQGGEHRRGVRVNEQANRALTDLIRQRTRGTWHTVSGLLTATAGTVRDALGDRPGGGPRLADLLAGLRDDVRKLRDAEHARRAGAGLR
jgi:hypothetical protein